MRDEWADPAAGELALAARRAREEVKRRALLSAGAVLVPLPGLDVAAWRSAWRFTRLFRASAP